MLTEYHTRGSIVLTKPKKLTVEKACENIQKVKGVPDSCLTIVNNAIKVYNRFTNTFREKETSMPDDQDAIDFDVIDRLSLMYLGEIHIYALQGKPGLAQEMLNWLNELETDTIRLFKIYDDGLKQKAKADAA